MPAKKPGKTDETRLMTWGGAVEACAKIWDEFESRWEEEIVKDIAKAEQEVARAELSESITSVNYAHETAQLKLTQLKNCQANFKAAFDGWREKSLHLIETKLCKQGGKREWREVRTRGKPSKRIVGGKLVVVKAKRGRKPNPLNAHKRKHRRTGRPRGWNSARFALPRNRAGNHPPIRELRKRRIEKRKQVLSDRRVGRLFRVARYSEKLKRHWRVYPWRRQPKVGGWLARWLTAWLKKLAKPRP